MCGIIGAMTFEGKLSVSEKTRREATIFFITELLQLTQTRGKDATGISTLFEDGNYMGLKMGIPSIEFISKFGGKETDYDGYLKLWREEKQAFKIFLGHCRKSSVGNSWDNVNNHPIKVGDLVGVHNGTLTNYEQIFDNLACKRDGEVDSEAIFRLLNHYSDNGKDPFSEEMIHEVATRLQGSYAVMTYNGNNPYQMAAFRDGKPIEMALIKPLNMVLIASESKFLKQAVFRLNKQIHIYNTFPKKLHLSDENVEYKTMVDDSMSIFDLTKEVTEETKLEDLFHTKKVLQIDKIWKKETAAAKKVTPPAKSIPPKTGTHNAWDNKKTEVNANSKDSKKLAGAVWNKTMRSYKPVEAEVKKATEIQCVDIDVDKDVKSEVIIPTTSKADKTSSKIADKVKGILGAKPAGEDFKLNPSKDAEKLVCGEPAEVIEMGSTADKQYKTLREIKKEISTEVDFSVDPKALDLAEKTVDKRKRFDNATDLIVGLELENERVLNKLPLHSLANRIQRFAQKLGFYQGYIKGKVDGAEESSIEAARKFKVIAMKLAEMIDDGDGTETIKGRFVDVHTRKLLDARDDLDHTTLLKMFSTGDLRKSFTLRRIIKVAGNKEKMKEKLAEAK